MLLLVTIGSSPLQMIYEKVFNLDFRSGTCDVHCDLLDGTSASNTLLGQRLTRLCLSTPDLERYRVSVTEYKW